MHLLVPLCAVWLLPLTRQEYVIPRKIIPFQRGAVYEFHEDGVSNYSALLVRDDLGFLVVGAQEALYAVDLHNVSKKLASVKWEVTRAQRDDCRNKGKDPETECKNFIRVLHKTSDGRMYVCGTNAFDPECDFMSYADGKLTLENKAEDGKGKCPFDPFQMSASLMVDDDLYSATSMNFLGSEPVFLRSPGASLRTEFKTSWLNEPRFVSLAHVPESEDSATGDDDKIYLFFSETAIECDCHARPVVSRVARVCKGDLGGERTLQKKWTSFLKARLECPVPESRLPLVIRDAFRWCDARRPWSQCLFYTVFTPQAGVSLSAVCVFSVLDVSTHFSQGKFLTPVIVDTNFVKWVMFSGAVPSPRPGACIDAAARSTGVNHTLVLPDQTLQFVKDRPLMDESVAPRGGRAELVRRGSAFTRIVVRQVLAADRTPHRVMFIGTEKGSVVKAANYDGRVFIIEEVQVFETHEPIRILRLSAVTDHLYAGSDSGVVQVPLFTCMSSSSCVDCVLHRDPHCGWDVEAGQCVAHAQSQKKVIQSLQDGDASLCPESAAVPSLNQSVPVGGNLTLHCTPTSNHAETLWELDGRSLTPGARLRLLPDALLIVNASAGDAGLYRCVALERSGTRLYRSVVSVYRVSVAAAKRATDPGAVTTAASGLHAAIAVCAAAFLALFTWNVYSGHFRSKGRTGRDAPQPQPLCE